MEKGSRMRNCSPTRSTPNSARPVSTPRNRDREFHRLHSARSSLVTPRRSAIDLAQAQGNAMKVYVRVRPFSERELSLNLPQHSTVRIDVENPCLITLLDPQREFRPRETFSFTRCLWSVLESEGAGGAANTNGNGGANGKSAGEIRDSIDTFINNNTISARGMRSRAMSNAGISNGNIHSARSRAATAGGGGNDISVPFEGAGSNAAIVSGINVVHPPYSSQQDVYNYVGRPVLDNTLEGYNGCVFAYGQTGSGKTFTMLGYTPKNSDFHPTSRRQSIVNDDDDDDDDDDGENSKPSIASISPARLGRKTVLSRQASRQDLFTRQVSSQVVDIVDTTKMDPNELQGIIPRISADLFKGLREKREKDPSHSYRVEVEYYEIYNEKVFDLIRPQKDADLKIRHHPVSGPYVEGLSSKVVSNEEQIAKVIRKGSIERHTASTKINDRSSRSHAIITFNILQLYLDDNDSTCKKQSKLNLVDLAGSERTGAVGAEGKQFLEGTKINLSLTTLGRVIDCLADLSQSKSLSVPVPYRDSNLTWLLMDSLGGNSKTSMVATISPHTINFDEMRQTIRYASRAKQIVNKAVINEDPQVRQIRALTAEVEHLKKVIREAGHNDFDREYVLNLQRRNSFLEKRCQEQEKTIVELRAELEENGIIVRTDDSNGTSARRKRAGAGQQETSVGRRRINNSEENNVSILRTKLADAMAEIEELRLQLSEEKPKKREESSGDKTQITELKSRIQSLKKEVDTLRSNDARKQRYLDRFSFFYMDWASDIVHNVMVLKEEEFLRHVVHLSIAQNDNVGDSLRHLQQSHREEMEQTRKRHKEEMEDLHKISGIRLKESIEKSSEFYQQLIDKHVEKLNYMEERMKKNKEFYDSEHKRMEGEKENMRKNYEEQITKERVALKEELKRLREQVNFSASDRQRSGENIKKIQEDHERMINKRQEEMDRYRRDKEHEIARLKQHIENETLRRESDLLEKERQRRLLEQEVNEMRRELLKTQSERNRLEQKHQIEIQNLTQQQEKLIGVSNGLLSDWDNRSSAMEASFGQLRALLHSQDYINFRARLREVPFEKKDYTAELEAVEERKRRDTKLLRDIVQQLKQNQEDSKASLQRFEEDVMQHLSRAGKSRQNSISGTGTGGNVGTITPNSSNNSFSSLNKPPLGARQEKKSLANITPNIKNLTPEVRSGNSTLSSGNTVVPSTK